MTSNRTHTSVLQSLRENLEKKSDELPDPDKPFNQEDAKEWKLKLDDIVAKVKQLEKDNKIQKGNLTSLQKEVTDLKNNIGSLPKKTWVRAAGNKILNYFENAAKAGFESLVEATVRGLIGDS